MYSLHIFHTFIFNALEISTFKRFILLYKFQNHKYFLIWLVTQNVFGTECKSMDFRGIGISLVAALHQKWATTGNYRTADCRSRGVILTQSPRGSTPILGYGRKVLWWWPPFLWIFILIESLFCNSTQYDWPPLSAEKNQFVSITFSSWDTRT